MSEEEFKEFSARVKSDQEQKDQAQMKMDRKLKKRSQKKELKKGVQDSCKTQ
jgi:hypothetical protein